MTTTLEEVGVHFTAKDDATRPLKNIEAAAKGAKRALKEVGDADTNNGLKRTTGSVGGLTTEVGRLHSGLTGASRTLGAFAAQTIRNTALGLGAATVAAGGFGLAASSSFEQSRIAFGTLLGGLEQGNDLFAQLQAYNLQTPFGLDGIARATQTLLQFDVAGDDVMKTLRSISDVAALTSNPEENLNRIAVAVGQISQAGVLRAEDLNQLVQSGFPAYQLLTEITGQTTAEIRKQMETGLDLPATAFIDAINERAGVLQRYAGGAQAQAETLSGVWSNFTDTLKVDLSTAADPLADNLKQVLPEVTRDIHALLTDVAPPLTTLAVGLLGGVAAAGSALSPVLTALSQGVSDFSMAAGPGLAGLGPVVMQLSVAMTSLFDELIPHAPALTGLFVDLVGILPEMVGVVEDLVPVAVGLGEGLSWLLELGPGQEIAATLLVTLLGYRALSGITTTVHGLAGAFRSLAGAEAAEAAASGVAGGPGRRAGRAGALAGGAAGLGLVGTGLMGEQTVMGDLSTVGGAALTGATLGSIIPGAGTAAGAAVGGAIGGGIVIGRRLAGDDRPRVPAALSAGGSTRIDRSITLGPGAIPVYEPSSNVDVSRAVEDGIRAYDAERDRRGGP